MERIKKLRDIFREVKGRHLTVYAANACYFLVLAVFPALLLLLGLLRRISLDADWLLQLPEGFLPEIFRMSLQKLIAMIYENSSGTTLGISAVTVLWSASRGMQGILTGLNAVYGRQEHRGWLRTRLASVGYTLGFLAALPATLALHLSGGGLGPVWMLPVMQTGIFTAMYMALPRGGNGFRESLPGAVLASLGWQIFTKGYSLYVHHFARLQNVYGSVYAIALSMLWLYGCMCIFLCGGAWNAKRQKEKKNMSES